nr:MAG TPA: hypothetical protein [Caudoviricetes sp.]
MEIKILCLRKIYKLEAKELLLLEKVLNWELKCQILKFIRWMQILSQEDIKQL